MSYNENIYSGRDDDQITSPQGNYQGNYNTPNYSPYNMNQIYSKPTKVNYHNLQMNNNNQSSNYSGAYQNVRREPPQNPTQGHYINNQNNYPSNQINDNNYQEDYFDKGMGIPDEYEELKNAYMQHLIGDKNNNLGNNLKIVQSDNSNN